MKFIDKFKAARRAGTPILKIETVDPASTMDSIRAAVNGAAVVLFDCVRGIIPLNNAGVAAVSAMAGEQEPAALTNPTEALPRALAMPEKGILFVLNAQLFIKEPQVIQSIWNARDEYKKNFRTMILLTPGINLPPELAADVSSLSEPLPTREELAGIVSGVYNDTRAKFPTMPELKSAVLDRCVDALSGVGSFTAEQVAAECVTENGIDEDSIWERKRLQVETNPGLRVYRGKEMPDEVKGVDELLGYADAMMEDCSVVLFLDEVEKMFAGLGNSQDSVTKELTGEILTWLEEKDEDGELLWICILLLGPAGTGKSMVAKAVGNKAKKLTVMMNISNMKESLLGNTQANFRRAAKTVDAIAGNKKRRLLLATSNDIGVLSPELKRRFAFGTFYLDLPTLEARDQLWKQYTKRYGLTDKDRPSDDGWTGAEIRNCCMIAKKLRKSLKEAALKVVPVSKSAPEQVTKLRAQATGRFLSASKPGFYEAPPLPVLEENAARRAVSVEAN